MGVETSIFILIFCGLALMFGLAALVCHIEGRTLASIWMSFTAALIMGSVSMAVQWGVV